MDVSRGDMASDWNGLPRWQQHVSSGKWNFSRIVGTGLLQHPISIGGIKCAVHWLCGVHASLHRIIIFLYFIHHLINSINETALLSPR